MIRCELFDESCQERYGDIRTDHVPRAGDALWFADGMFYRVHEVWFMVAGETPPIPPVATVRLLCTRMQKNAPTP